MNKIKEKRQYRVTIYLTYNEVKFLNEFTKSAGGYRSELIRKLIHSIQADVKIIKTDELLKALRFMASEQGGINSNLNELVIQSNPCSKTCQNQNVFTQFNELLARYLDYQEVMNKTLKDIYFNIC